MLQRKPISLSTREPCCLVLMADFWISRNIVPRHWPSLPCMEQRDYSGRCADAAHTTICQSRDRMTSLITRMRWPLSRHKLWRVYESVRITKLGNTCFFRHRLPVRLTYAFRPRTYNLVYWISNFNIERHAACSWPFLAIAHDWNEFDGLAITMPSWWSIGNVDC